MQTGQRPWKGAPCQTQEPAHATVSARRCPPTTADSYSKMKKLDLPKSTVSPPQEPVLSITWNVILHNILIILCPAKCSALWSQATQHGDLQVFFLTVHLHPKFWSVHTLEKEVCFLLRKSREFACAANVWRAAWWNNPPRLSFSDHVLILLLLLLLLLLFSTKKGIRKSGVGEPCRGPLEATRVTSLKKWHVVLFAGHEE